jgi:hypothetical protein
VSQATEGSPESPCRVNIIDIFAADFKTIAST